MLGYFVSLKIKSSDGGPTQLSSRSKLRLESLAVRWDEVSRNLNHATTIAIISKPRY